MDYPGQADLDAAVADLADQLPAPLRALARVAYDYQWCWARDGAALFEAIDPQAWLRCGANPLRLLTETRRSVLLRAAADASLVERAERLARALAAERERPWLDGGTTPAQPVAFCCAEFGIHGSLPIYSGGLGVLAGDILKEASDLGLAMVGVGLLYRTGYFHQRIDASGQQHEYWLASDPERLACVRVTGADGRPVTVSVPVDDEEVAVQVWRCDVGRVPLYLLDTDRPENSPVGRWITSRLYESNRAIRLAQYAVLGVGGQRMLHALGIEPALVHLNEGHPALGVYELHARARRAEPALDEDAAWQRVRERVVFTTHTPVAAGNETYAPAEIMAMLGGLADTTALRGGREAFAAMGRIHPADPGEPSGMTVLALRSCRQANAVSQRHGQVARAMWQPVYPGRASEGVPITHVTNGVHVPTWAQGPMRDLLDRYLGPDWLRRADRAETWAPVEQIPPAELWAARNAARARLVGMIRRRVLGDRLGRGDTLDYATAATEGFGPERLTIGFARRLATYKRLHLIGRMPERAVALVGGERPVQFVFAGKAHPADAEAKEVVRRLFELKASPAVAGRAAFVEDYDLMFARHLVGGCDIWVNLPRPPLEASGTSGMKSVLGGGLQLSVLDGWWAEGYDGANGFAIDGRVDADPAAQDWRDAGALYDLLEQQIVPMFHERDADGVPQRWVAMIKRSLMTLGPRFSATRMLRDYVERIYRLT